ncbi:MAG TPA: dephospho-CoA kinase [Burkholderiales bacterium]|nr:dephospho-CoA kinase [Burkholderiales bacterium]
MAFIVGLTGGIGSGKSAAADEFARLGAAVVDTDAIAHELTRAGGAAIAGVRRVLGDEFVDASGAMDRAKVRSLVFSDRAARARLEGLLHPMIRAESERRIGAATAPYVVHVVPLLVESPDYRQRVQRVLVVDCSPQVQKARVGQRSGLAIDEVERIIDAQIPRETRLAAADDVIDNSGSLDALHKQVRALHRRYLDMARTPA